MGMWWTSKGTSDRQRDQMIGLWSGDRYLAYKSTPRYWVVTILSLQSQINCVSCLLSSSCLFMGQITHLNIYSLLILTFLVQEVIYDTDLLCWINPPWINTNWRHTIVDANHSRLNALSPVKAFFVSLKLASPPLYSWRVFTWNFKWNRNCWKSY